MVMDYKGYGFTRKGQERFYRDIEKQKQEISNMDVDECTKENLLEQTENLIKEYEKSKIRHLNSEIYKIRSEENSKKRDRAVKTITSKLGEINDSLEHWKKMNVQGKHLMYKDNSYN